MDHRGAHNVLEHGALRRVHVRIDTCRQHGGDVHVLIVDVLRAQVAGQPAPLIRLRSKLAPFTGVHDALLEVAIAPQSLELEVVLTFVICLGDNGLGDRALTSLGLIFGHDLFLRFAECLGVVTPVILLPLRKTARHLVLDIGAPNLYLRNGDVTVALLVLIGKENLTESTAVIVVCATANQALSKTFLTSGRLVFREE